MCRLGDITVSDTVKALARALDMTKVPASLWDYALLVEVTETPLDRAIVYLRDCDGSPEHATGRLLLRAAERVLRAAGELAQ